VIIKLLLNGLRTSILGFKAQYLSNLSLSFRSLAPASCKKCLNGKSFSSLESLGVVS